MSYVLKRDNCYIRVKNSKPTMTGELKRATKYNTIAQAEGFINNNIKPEERNTYQVVKTTTEKLPPISSIISKPKAVTKTVQPTVAITKTDVMDDLQAVKRQIMSRYETKKSELVTTIERCDAIILDIRHFSRDNKTRLNACQAAKAFYKQQEIERKREQAKMELNRIYAVEKFVDNAISVADDFYYDDYRPREVEDMTEFLGL